MGSLVNNPAQPGPGQLIRIIIITILGSALIFAGVVLMNRFVSEPEPTETASAIDFTVPEARPDTPPPPEPKPQRQTTRQSDAGLAPLPVLGGSLSGISLSLPQFEATGGQGVSESLLGDLDDVVMTEDAVDTPPIARNVSVPYPERAQQRDIEGQVIVSVHIDAAGKVLNVQILESSPPGVFDAAVLEASRDWKFTPAKYRGEGVDTWVNIPIPFRLN